MCAHSSLCATAVYVPWQAQYSGSERLRRCRYYPFGQGSGERVKQEFGLPHLIRFPILPELSEAGDGKAPILEMPHGTPVQQLPMSAGHLLRCLPHWDACATVPVTERVMGHKQRLHVLYLCARC